MPKDIEPKDIDLTEFEAKQVHVGVKCHIASLVLSPEQHEKLHAALLATHIRHSTISTVLDDWGFHVSPQAISTHRKGIRGQASGCKCLP